MPVGPQEWRSWQGASINFALTLSMRDTERLFYGLRTSQPAAPYQAPRIEWKHHGPSQNRTLRVALHNRVSSRESSFTNCCLSCQKAVAFLEDQGHQVTEIRYPVDGQTMMASYYRMNGGETAAMFSEIEGNAATTSGTERYGADDLGAVPIWQKISGCRLYSGIAILGSAGSNDGSFVCRLWVVFDPLQQHKRRHWSKGFAKWYDSTRTAKR